MSYIISFEDALDHATVADTFDTLEEAKKGFDEWVAKGPDGYDIGVELIEVTNEDTEDEEWESLDYHEWFTLEAWNEAHPSGRPD